MCEKYVISLKCRVELYVLMKGDVILAINMSGAEFARSKVGQSKLITEYQNDLNKIISSA